MEMNRSVEEIHIENLSKKRYEYIHQYNDSWDDEVEDYTIEEPKEIDELGDEILKYIKLWKRSLPFEFIFEELTKLGHAPSLLYDDDGRFAIVSDGYQTVPIGEATDVEMGHLVKKERWKDSIRGALDDYLNNDEEE